MSVCDEAVNAKTTRWHAVRRREAAPKAQAPIVTATGLHIFMSVGREQEELSNVVQKLITRGWRLGGP